MSKARSLAALGNAYDDGALSNRNLIINGAMQVWQRGAGPFAGNNYTADRWRCGDFNATIAVSQGTFTPASTYPNLFKNFLQYDIQAPATTGDPNLQQRIEDCLTANGQTVTLSFWARCVSGTYEIGAWVANNSGGDGGVTDTKSVTLTTTWTQYSMTFDIPEVTGGTTGSSTYLRLNFLFPMASGTGTIQFTGVQLEVGDTATPFEHRSYGQELALCQRYFQRSVQTVGTTFGYGDGDVAAANCVNTNWLMDNLGFKVTMRAIPTFRNSGGAGTTGTVMRSSTGGNISLTLTCRTDGEVRGFPGGNVNAYESVQFSWDADAEL